MVVGTLRLDLLLGDVHSLKAKRAVVRPVLAQLVRQYKVSTGEVGYQDLHRRVLIGVGLVGDDPSHVVEVLEQCEHAVAERPELVVLSAHRRVFSDEDE
ncbi:MAG: DUF503 domain-containing protein [Actinomycetes bacterium]